jgi:transposase-like protein
VSLPTSTGKIEDLQVKRDREGQFHTQLFERYNRYEQQVADGITEMFVSGTSTQKVEKVAEKLMGITPSKSSVSRLNQTLTEQFETWRIRKLASVTGSFSTLTGSTGASSSWRQS